MGKREPAKLTPVTSQATYPTLIEARRDGGFLLKGLAAAVLATGLAGCGKSTETSMTPDAAGLAGAIPALPDGALPDRATAPEAGGIGTAPEAGIGGAIDVAGLYDSPIKDATDPGDTPSEPDAATKIDAPDTARPDLGSPDRLWIMDGVPTDTRPWDTALPKDTSVDSPSPDASTDSESDVK